ncbi:hypothetical protein EDD18DRAFT_1334408 [Armillaria luteobubalina]|uniref:Uncharacterized protein n=1 Tax=Armillaria luteobubalina TaxID=153913 RepID=A0AA39PWW6_9AGAR|nr:hypothetical protein EDD18DRAFT_1334408 [Armillaria luteobubalina]
MYAIFCYDLGASRKRKLQGDMWRLEGGVRRGRGAYTIRNEGEILQKSKHEHSILERLKISDKSRLNLCAAMYTEIERPDQDRDQLTMYQFFQELDFAERTIQDQVHQALVALCQLLRGVNFTEKAIQAQGQNLSKFLIKGRTLLQAEIWFKKIQTAKKDLSEFDANLRLQIPAIERQKISDSGQPRTRQRLKDQNIIQERNVTERQGKMNNIKSPIHSPFSPNSSNSSYLSNSNMQLQTYLVLFFALVVSVIGAPNPEEVEAREGGGPAGW